MLYLSTALLWALALSSCVAEVSSFHPASVMHKQSQKSSTSLRAHRSASQAALNFRKDENTDLMERNVIEHTAVGAYIRPVKRNEIASIVSLRVNVFYPEFKTMSAFHARIYEKLRNRIVKRGSTCLAAFRDEASASEQGKASANALFGNILGTIEVSSADFRGTAMESVGSKHKLYCCDLAVQESVRRNGLATKLLRTVEDFARTEGYDELYLHVERGNAAAEALYLREGYQIIPSLSWAVEFTESHLQKSYDRYLFLWKGLQQPSTQVEALSGTTTSEDAEYEKTLQQKRETFSPDQEGVVMLE